ncbi:MULTISPECIES: cytochrome c oxidase accessory protein CcoG [Idiomarinaceae]|uniref:Cytochrome c oxidase accessory protein FixG n=4 Tax=Pseudidiomarina TaxID=2800384 RepID=A0A368UMK2_9GAMM|nr:MULTISPECIES: cytochrome c oxidase accessory protein CcoG [Idiomarinaceae]MDT7525409.1 cytochrome c oxidase accessory protein CcoG [Pseudidiomarina sp. GXY010]MDX1526838.1 cytochrome c oxidase accessory protein CcoG [Pseudidiomarina maritima]MRJ43017.1 cytochrome c oxidase accessory protein CcoG [Idiomarina sp. FeN1]NCU58570.1 cytochrome c oxidase accessory protein CcoG [Idiomarina sp. FenA--70]NCU61267.1 cytochrome c oxidase accessory protein CcoG [Idiomarina sp. FenBw--71]
MEQKVKVLAANQVKIERPDPNKRSNDYSPRNRIYVRDVKGTLEWFRRGFGFILLAMFALIPWLQWNGEQAVLLDIAEQRFRIFGLTLWPQDLTILAWIAIVSAFALFFVTTLYGRVWCGFMCPQTTWTFIFMWFEKKFEGSRNQRMSLDKRPWDFDKLWRKTAKHVSWVIVALLTAMIFVGYFTDIRSLFTSFWTFDAGFWATFSVIFFAFCTYGNAGWMREIMCTHMCPYARFQSAMFDKDTVTVSYDTNRGEPRGGRSRKKDPKELGLGDCIDCYMCVQVCPTGIDIRNGLQYECINCGACVDACNDVMDKMNYPRGLIRFTTERNLQGGRTHKLRFKSVGYFLVMLVMSGLLVWDIATRVPLEVNVIRDRNQLYTYNMDGWVQNVFTLKVLNKSQLADDFVITVEGYDNAKLMGQTELSIGGGDVATVPLTLAIDPADLPPRGNAPQARVEINFVVQNKQGDVVQRHVATFLYD